MPTLSMTRPEGFINRLFKTSGKGGTQPMPGETELSETVFVVVDTELTGLKPRTDSVVSIGAIHMTGPRIELGNFFYRVVKPASVLTGHSVVIHGITPTEAGDSPAFEVLLPEFLSFCEGRIIVGYCVSIDMLFLNREIRRLGGHPLRNPIVDILKLYSWVRRKERNACAFDCGDEEAFDLMELAQKFGITANNVHNALSDAFITAQLFQRLLAAAAGYGLKRLDDLLAVAKPD